MDGTAGTIRLGDFVFEPDIGRLTARDGSSTVLRPKSSALLHLLLTRRGQLVTKDDIFDAVWPGLTVTEDSIVQCVGEIRRALGPGAAALHTLHRRGYRLDAGDGPGGDQASAEPPVAVPAAETPRVEVPVAAPVAAGTPRGRSTALALRVALALGAAGAGVAALLLAGHPMPAAPVAAEAVDPRAEAARLAIEAGLMITAPGEYRSNMMAARSLAERAIALDPTNAVAHAHAAVTYTNLVLNGLSRNPASDLGRAEGHVEQALTFAPHRAVVQVAHGALLRNQGRFEEARSAYLRATEVDPRHFAARFNVGLMTFLLGDPETGAAAMRATVAAAPPDYVFRRNWLVLLALAELQRERWDEAASLLREGLRSRTLLPRLHGQALLAAALHRSGAPAEDVAALVAEIRASDPAVGAAHIRSRPLSQEPAYAARQEVVLRAVEDAGLP